MRRDAHNVRKTLKKVQTASRMYVLDTCGYEKWVLQPQFNYRQPPQAHSAHSNMGGSEAMAIKGGLPAERQHSLYTSKTAALFETLCVCRTMRQKHMSREHLELQL